MTYQRILPRHILIREPIPILIDEIKRPANLGLSDSLGLVRYPFPRHALLLVCKVKVETDAGADEEDGCCDIEGLAEGTEWLA